MKEKKGFTLIEVLVVVIIIGILAMVAIPQFTKSIERSRGAEARAALRNIYTAEQAYFAQNETYTPTYSVLATSYDVPATLGTDWSFSIISGDATTFVAEALRTGSGPFADQKLQINQDGGPAGSNWEFK